MLNTFCSDLLKYMLKHILLHLIPDQVEWEVDEQALNGPQAHKKSTQLPLSAFACFRDPDRIRTCDPQLRRLLLYPAELPDQSFSLEIRRADVERGCKGNAFFLFCK